VKSIRVLTMLVLAFTLLGQAEIPEWLVKANAEEAQQRTKQKRGERSFINIPVPRQVKPRGPARAMLSITSKHSRAVVPTTLAPYNGRL
jgi:hypothetical protein